MISLDALLPLANPSHTEMQMDRFITIRSGGTPYGCFFQALRELLSRYHGLHSSYLQRRKLGIKLKHYRELSEGEGYRAELAAVKVSEFEFAISQMAASIGHTEREFLRFYSQAAGLFVHLGFDREPPTAERLAQLDAERWEHNLRCMIALDLFTNGRPTKGTAELLQCFPPDVRKKIGAECMAGEDSHARCIAWYFDYVPDLPKPLAIPEDECRRLLACCESNNSPRLLPNSYTTGGAASPEISFPNDSWPAKNARAVTA